MVVDVKAEGTNFLYVTNPFEELSAYNFKFSCNLFVAYDVPSVKNAQLILDEWKNNVNNTSVFSYSYLFWLKNKNVEELNNRIIRGHYSDDDFVDSIKCEFHPHAFCKKCRSAWEVLAVDRIVRYPGNKELKAIKLKKLIEYDSILKCPNCNSYFHESYVVKIFGSATLERSALEKGGYYNR